MHNHLAPVETSGSSPFDEIKHTRDDGSEYWSARELMPLMGYGKWQSFEVPLKRAMKSAEVQGANVAANFTGSRKDAVQGKMPQQDYHLTRFAAYLVAMNGDPNKSEVSAAQAYFAIQTHVAETRPAVPALPRDYASALRELADQYERAEMEATRARELEAPAKSWEALAAPGGDYSVAGAAKTLSRDPNIEIGRDRLFRFMHELGWIYRTTGKRAHWEAYQDKGIKPGRLVHKLGGGFINEKTGEWEQTQPTVRITPKGLHELHKSLGGSDQMILSLEAIA